jgi:FkbM family methyltransferase
MVMIQRAKRAVRRAQRYVDRWRGKECVPPVQVKCNKEYHGTEYGGYMICPDGLHADSIVYAFGLGGDISFELSIIDKYGLTVAAFDPSPESIRFVKSEPRPEQLKLYEYGLADYDGIARFAPLFLDHSKRRQRKRISNNYTILDMPASESAAVEFPVHRLQTVMDLLGHDHIDILKLDIEGAEYAVIKDLVQADKPIDQILVEVHHRFKSLDVTDTRNLIRTLNEKGYKIFHVSDHWRDYAFIRR